MSILWGEPVNDFFGIPYIAWRVFFVISVIFWIAIVSGGVLRGQPASWLLKIYAAFQTAILTLMMPLAFAMFIVGWVSSMVWATINNSWHRHIGYPIRYWKGIGHMYKMTWSEETYRDL